MRDLPGCFTPLRGASLTDPPVWVSAEVFGALACQIVLSVGLYPITTPPALFFHVGQWNSPQAEKCDG